MMMMYRSCNTRDRSLETKQWNGLYKQYSCYKNHPRNGSDQCVHTGAHSWRLTHWHTASRLLISTNESTSDEMEVRPTGRKTYKRPSHWVLKLIHPHSSPSSYSSSSLCFLFPRSSEWVPSPRSSLCRTGFWSFSIHIHPPPLILLRLFASCFHVRLSAFSSFLTLSHWVLKLIHPHSSPFSSSLILLRLFSSCFHVRLSAFSSFLTFLYPKHLSLLLSA